MQSRRLQTISISNHVERIVQNAGILSGRKSESICLKSMMVVSISGERKTAQLHIIKVALINREKGLVYQVSGIRRSHHWKALCITKAKPCNAPQMTNMMLLPCQIPTSSRVMRQ